MKNPPKMSTAEQAEMARLMRVHGLNRQDLADLLDVPLYDLNTQTLTREQCVALLVCLREWA